VAISTAGSRRFGPFQTLSVALRPGQQQDLTVVMLRAGQNHMFLHGKRCIPARAEYKELDLAVIEELLAAVPE
jgi:hypothetical protein